MKAIGAEAFSSLPNLRSVTVPDGVEEIGNKAFYDCTKLRTATLPAKVKSMGTQVFCYCQSLLRVNIPTGLTELPRAMSMCCASLQQIDIPDGVTTIGKSMFYDCTSLVRVSVPASVTTIGQTTFHGCHRLQSLALPNVTSIYDDTSFDGCNQLFIQAPESSYAWQYAQKYGYVPEKSFLESPHPYAMGDCFEFDETYTYTYEGEAQALRVTFSPRTYVIGAFGTDTLTVTDGYGAERTYTEDELAGKTLVLRGNTFSVRLYSEWTSDQDFGFRVTQVEPVGMEDYATYLEENEFTFAVVNGVLVVTQYILVPLNKRNANLVELHIRGSWHLDFSRYFLSRV